MYLLISTLLLIFSCGEEKNNSHETTNVNSISETTHIQEVSDTLDFLSDNQKKVLSGAKQTLAQGYKYDLTMGYYVTQFNEHGEFVGGRVFPGGDINPEIGVCTDVVVRALRLGGVVDLQQALNDDIKKNFNDYPMRRWGARKADPNIDQRRVMNLEVWFSKYWQVINDDEDWQPGDIVVWDMSQNGASDHIGIVSDKKSNGRYWVIHNHPNPGYVAEEDKLFRWRITGHYRIKE